MPTIPPADSIRGPGALSAHDNDSHVLAELLDDVFTSGSTMNEAVKTLKTAGAKKIIGLVAAKAG